LTNPHFALLGQSESIEKVEPLTHICSQRNYFWFAAAILETDGNRHFKNGLQHHVTNSPTADTGAYVNDGTHEVLPDTRAFYTRLGRMTTYDVRLRDDDILAFMWSSSAVT